MLGLRLRQVRLGIMAEVGFEVRTRTKVRSGAGIGAGAGEHRYLPCVDSRVLSRASVDDDGNISDQLRHCSQAHGEA